MAAWVIKSGAVVRCLIMTWMAVCHSPPTSIKQPLSCAVSCSDCLSICLLAELIFFFRDDILILQLCFCRLFFGCSPIWANMTVWERTESFLFVCFWIVIWMNNILFAWIMSDELNYQLCWSIRINEKHFPLLLRCEQGKWMFEKKTIIKLSLCQKENFFFLIRIVQMLVDILSLSLSLSTFGCIWIILIRQIYALEMDA